ncbi:MAG TPA: TonB family protein [Pyrinomonadaceae bacterium]|jgi:TonB family protein|nr:TonB family protein [Pyrinomonadaceae bacterium]
MKKYLFLTVLICLAAGPLLAQTAKPTPATMIAKLGVLNGKATNLPTAAYPPAAAKSGASGAVTVEVTVDESGDVISAKSDFANELLRNSAIAAAQQAKFTPYMFQGKPRKVMGTLVYNFVAPKDNALTTADLDAFLKVYNKDDSGKYNVVLGIVEIPSQIEEGKYDSAIVTLNKLVASDAKDHWALSYRAFAYYYKNDLVRALNDANAALAVKPEDILALNVRALVELKNKQNDLAKKDFDAAIAVSTAAVTARPGSMDDYFARAETYRFRGDNEKAAADYRKTLQLTPDYQYAQKHLDQVTAKQHVAVANTGAEIVKTFKIHFDEYTRLETLFEAAGDKVDKLEAALEADNAKNGRTKFAKPADNTEICTALSDLDKLYDKWFSEYYDMNEMKEMGDLEGHPDFIKFVGQAEERMDGLGGGILTRQMLWGCKQQK